MSMLPFLAQRHFGYTLLTGRGIEIGAFEHPAPVPPHCKVEYCDAITPEQAKELFPELKDTPLVPIDHILDLNLEGLSKFSDDSWDFVIFNHVIEHVVNPIYMLGELFRVLKRGGCLVIAAPDKKYTFDKNRPITPWSHVLADYEANAKESTPEDYLDMIKYIHVEHLNAPPEELRKHLQRFKDRREHLHVWDSAAFREFLEQALLHLKIKALPLFEVTGAQNQFEYFGVWVKGGDAEKRAFDKFFAQPPPPSQSSWIVEKINYHYRRGGVAGILKAIGSKSARMMRGV